jgi:cell division transport system ATP-binding protein
MQENTSKTAVHFQNVELIFEQGTRLFSGLNLTIETGGFYFLTGVSGAGKSTLLKMIYMGCKQSSGSVTLFGTNTSCVSFREIAFLRRKIGIVFQDFRLIPHLTIVDNVALPLQVRGISLKKARAEAAELLSWVGLKDHLQSLPYTLSGGEQQRVAISRAVIGRPKLLVADEPTGNVDDGTALKLLYLFEEMHKQGTTVILATHNRHLAQELKYPEIFLDKGQAFLLRPQTLPHEVFA